MTECCQECAKRLAQRFGLCGQCEQAAFALFQGAAQQLDASYSAPFQRTHRISNSRRSRRSSRRRGGKA